MSKSIQTAMADCTKCRIRHARPVGVRCRRNLNISAPVAEADHSRVQVQFNAQPSTSQPETLPATEMLEGNSSSRASDSSQSGQGPMDSKLDLILRKMEQIEKKNKELEMKLHSNAKGRSVSRLSHSSPKRSHKCSTSCSSHTHKKRRSHGASNMESFDTSADPLEDSSTIHSHSHISQAGNSTSASEQVSVDYLKSDERIQRQVQRQLERLQGKPRLAQEGNKTFKSGLHRSGDNTVQHNIAWPHHFCFPNQGGQLPEYKELSPLQFMVGFLGCLQEESSSTIRSNMIEYGRHLFQDALETNWTTAKHAHMMLLQEIERGKCSWRHPDMVEKIRIRNTARIITPNPTTASTRNVKRSKDKICTDFNSNNCKYTSDHIVDGVIHKHACSYCYQEVGRLCNHKIHDCLRRKAGDSNKEVKKSN